MKMLAVCLLVFMAISQIRASEMADLIKRSGPCTGWAEFNGYCYRYIPTPMSWAKAEKNCISMNAHLASVHNIDQYKFIQSVITQASHGYPETWIGGSDPGETYTWLWTDGSPFDYTNWCPGEPSNYYQRCLQMNYAGDKCWDDLQCWKKRPFVCRKKWVNSVVHTEE